MTAPVAEAILKVTSALDGTCLRAMVKWGQALNKMVALPKDAPERAVAATEAKLQGLEVQQLAMAIADYLGKDGQ